jgi:excisionase family DNA binding protein
MSIEQTLQELVSQQVRAEVRRVVAELHRPDEYLSTRSAASLASVTQGTVRRWVKEGRLARHMAGRVVRVSRLELERFLRDGGAKNDEETPEQNAAKRFG